jgi:PhnB protein
MNAITPYLVYSGRCEEALEFYRTKLGAEIDMVMKFNESPTPTPPGVLQPGFEKKVMHCSFRINGALIMASDGCDDKGEFKGFNLSLTVADEAEAKRRFEALSDGGKITMPLTKTFWSPCFGMVTDRFGVSWMVIVPSPM